MEIGHLHAAPFLEDLRKEIIESGMTFRELGARSGVSGTTIFNIAHGRHKPKFELTLRIARELNYRFYVQKPPKPTTTKNSKDHPK